MNALKLADAMLFLSTLSLRRATSTRQVTQTCRVISIHALLAESDDADIKNTSFHKLFLSTLSLRRATREPTALRTPHHNFRSTLSLRRATLTDGSRRAFILYFYPRSPCGERLMHALKLADAVLFLSTLSLRRATYTNLRRHCGNYHFYPRSPCGERRGCEQYYIHALGISIHALLAESDQRQTRRKGGTQQFLSTLSLRRATSCTSIGRPKRLYFYPRSPCGERQAKLNRTARKITFLSTLSLRRATRWNSTERPAKSHFYPRSPCGERRKSHKLAGLKLAFLSTLSLRRATSNESSEDANNSNFYPRSPCGERQESRQPCGRPTTISIHALLAESDK